MNVAKYTFQSPSSSPVQVGKLDPSSVKEEQKSTQNQQSAVTAKTPEEWLENNAQNASSVKPTVTEHGLDIYV